MATPQRVKDDAAAADAALQQLVVPPVPDLPPPPPIAPVDNVVPLAPAPVPPPPVPSVQPTDEPTELQRLQQQLTTQEGRNAAQEREMIELRGRLAQLTEQLARQPAPAPAPAPAPTPKASLITPQDQEDFGTDMIDFVQRVIDDRLGHKVDAVLQRLVSLESGLRQASQQATVAAKSAEELAMERYMGQLDALVPGWRKTNDEGEFLQWLQKQDKFARKSRHELLVDAHQQADAETVAEFFKAYWSENGITPAPQPAPTPAAPAPVQQPIVDPATLVAPTPSSSPTPAANPRGGKLWTQAEIEKVYDDRIKKRISTEDFAKLEREIQQAVIEGRVQA